MSDKRAFKGVWIPASVWLDKKLSIQEKVMLVEIDSLDADPKRGCYKRNEGFAEFFGLSKNRVSEIIKGLESKGYIRVSYQREGKQIVERNIFMVTPFEKSNTPSENSDNPFGKSGEPPSENSAESNTLLRGNNEGLSSPTGSVPVGTVDQCANCYEAGYAIPDCWICGGTGVEEGRPAVTNEVKPEQSEPEKYCIVCGNKGYIRNPDMSTSECECVSKGRAVKQPAPDKPKRKTKADRLVDRILKSRDSLPNLAGIPEELLAEWASLRCKKSASDSDRALKTIEDSLTLIHKTYGVSPEKAIAKQCDKGWTTVEPEYFEKNKTWPNPSYPPARQSTNVDSPITIPGIRASKEQLSPEECEKARQHIGGLIKGFD